MRTKYPFFREPEENAVAVIGEEAAVSDLGGNYRKPYAVLTDKRLYCKNKSGNYITDAGSVRFAGTTLLPGPNWFMWAAVALAGLALALLLIWYWGMDGKYQIDHRSDGAQRTIDNYYATKEKLPEYREAISSYEKLQKEIEQDQKKLESMDSSQLQANVNSLQQTRKRLQTSVNEATKARDDLGKQVSSLRNEIDNYKSGIDKLEKEIEKVDLDKNNQILSDISNINSSLAYWHSELRRVDGYPGDFPAVFNGKESTVSKYRSYCNEQIDALEKELDEIYDGFVDVDLLSMEIMSLETSIADSEESLKSLQQDYDKAQKKAEEVTRELNGLQSQINTAERELSEANAEIDGLKNQIENKQDALHAIPYSDAQNAIRQFDDLKDSITAAQRTQKRVKLFMPGLVALAAVFAVLLILALIKQVRFAAAASLVIAVVGVYCGTVTYLGAALRIVLYILSVLAAIAGALSLWWNRRRTVFQIAHATGSFSFRPNDYPASELADFRLAVEALKDGEANGQ